VGNEPARKCSNINQNKLIRKPSNYLLFILCLSQEERINRKTSIRVKRGETIMAVKVDKATCTGCAACASACPVEAIKVAEKAEVNEETCIDCGTCVDECPVQALSL
jgi:ferredoxin